MHIVYIYIYHVYNAMISHGKRNLHVILSAPCWKKTNIIMNNLCFSPPNRDQYCVFSECRVYICLNLSATLFLFQLF